MPDGSDPYPTNPIATNGLQLWLQADTGVTTNSGGLVSSWADQSVNGLNATQEVSGVQPQWVTNVFNGKPAVRFNGTNAFLKTAYTHLSGGLTYVVVFRTTSTDATATYSGNAANNLIGDNTGGIYVGFGVHGGVARYNHYVASWNHVNGTQTVNNAAARVATVTHNAGTGTVNLYVDGVAQTNATIGYSTAYASFNRLGGGYVNGSSTGDLFDGDIAEVLVYTRVLSTQERQAAEEYFSGKYALSNSDTDEDGLPDAWELRHFGDLNRGPTEDPDGDGFTNLQEYQNDTDPNDDTNGGVAPTGLQLWLKADAGVTTNSGGLVTSWADQSGGVLHATQEVSAAQPQWVTNVFNGKPVVRFNGTNSFLKTAYTHLSGGLTYVVAFRTTSTNATTNAGHLTSTFIGDNTGASYLGFGMNGGLAQYNHYGAGWQQAKGTQTVNNAAGHVATVTHHAGTGAVNLYVDGVAQTNATIGYSTAYASLNRIGGGYLNGSSTGDLLDGDIAEMLVYTRVLSTEERQAAEEYFSGKYGLSNSDTDEDELADAWELRHFGDLNRGPSEDPDGDGLTNLQEYQNDTDPNDRTNGAVTTTGLKLWLYADAGVMTNGNGLVSSWADQSGSGLNATQEVSGVQPQWVTNAFNGKPAVRFNGTSAFLKTAYAQLSGGLTYVVVLRTTSMDATASYNGNAANNLIGDSTGGVYVGFGVHGGVAQYNHYVASWNHVNGTQTVNNAAAHVATVTHNAGTGTVNLYLDGTAQSSSTLSYSSYTAFNRIGGGYVNGSATGDLFEGDVAEVLVYTRVLSTEERQAAEGYLIDRYAVSNSGAEVDNLPDDWERHYFGNLYETEDGDFDDDGFTNLQEYQNATDPTQADTDGDWIADGSDSNPTISSGFTVTNGIKLWLRADAGAIAGTNNAVSTWLDQSGHGHHAVAPASANQPACVTNALNGKPVVSFDGGNSALVTDSVDWSGNDYSYFVVWKKNGNASGYHNLFLRHAASGDHIHFYSMNGSTVLNAVGSTSWQVGRSTALFGNSDGYRLAGVTRQDNTALATKVYVDGVLDGESTLTPGSSPVGTNGAFYIGNYSTAYANMSMAEMMVYDRVLSAAERIEIELYLGEKYGVSVPDTDNLPDDWERFYFGSLDENDDGDFDGDGLTNLEEYQLETDPTSDDRDGDDTADGTDPNPTIPTGFGATNGLRLWLQADVGIVSGSTNAVSIWLDQSGQGNHAAAIAGVYRPLLETNRLNGKPSVKFDGEVQYLATPSVDWPSNDYSYFVIWKKNGEPGSGYHSILARMESFTTGGNYFQLRSSPGWDRAVAFMASSWQAGVSATYFGNDDPYRLVGLTRLDNTPKGTKLYVDGMLEGESFAAPVAPNPLDATGQEFYIGCFSAAAANISVAEILVYDRALSEAERQEVEEYLGQKYAVAVGDQDSLPDSWEQQHFGNLSQVDNADFDNDGLSNLEEYEAGADPARADSDGDGVPDGIEAHGILTDPFAGNAFQTTDVDVVNGSETNATLGIWVVDGTEIYSVQHRGYVEYSVNVSTADVYRVQVEIAAQNPLLTTNVFDLAISVDGERTSRSITKTIGSASAFVCSFTPWLQQGTHTVRITWDNAAGYRWLRIKSLRLQSVLGADSNGNGVKDWVENWLAHENTVDIVAATSVVSPACIEGHGRYVSMMGVVGGAVPKHGIQNRWYADVLLSSTNVSSVQVSFENGGLVRTNLVEWTPTDLLTSTDLTIRKGDSLRLTAAPSGATNGTVSVEVVGVTNCVTTVDAPVIHLFDAAGSYTVTGTYTPDQGAPTTRSIVVTVVEGAFNGSPACLINQVRSWDCASIPDDAVIEADTRTELYYAGDLQGGGSRFNQSVEVNEPQYVLARLGQNGPVLTSAQANGFQLYTAADTYNKIVEEYPDGSLLLEALLVLSPLLPDLTVEVNSENAGVTFDDGTISKEFTSADFDELGQRTVRFLMPAGVIGVNCHNIRVLEGSLAIGTK